MLVMGEWDGVFHVNNVRFDPSLTNSTSFIQFSGWFLDLSRCLPSFPPKQKETQAPHLDCVWLPGPGDFPWIRVQQPGGAGPGSSLPCPGAQSQFGAVPAATSLQEFRPSSGL